MCACAHSLSCIKQWTETVRNPWGRRQAGGLTKCMWRDFRLEWTHEQEGKSWGTFCRRASSGTCSYRGLGFPRLINLKMQSSSTHGLTQKKKIQEGCALLSLFKNVRSKILSSCEGRSFICVTCGKVLGTRKNIGCQVVSVQQIVHKWIYSYITWMHSWISCAQGTDWRDPVWKKYFLDCLIFPYSDKNTQIPCNRTTGYKNTFWWKSRFIFPLLQGGILVIKGPPNKAVSSLNLKSVLNTDCKANEKTSLCALTSLGGWRAGISKYRTRCELTFTQSVLFYNVPQHSFWLAIWILTELF